MSTPKLETKKIIVILGQTATGKSDFAVQIAREIGGEVISADSRQVYIGLDIGTGKITKREMKKVPHHLLDVANPKSIFTVAKYQKLAEKKIKEITKRGHVPIICGGTGFYIDAVVHGIALPEVPPNKKLRKELYSKSAIALFEYLKKLDHARAKTIDKANPVRLIRAIEIAKVLGSVPTFEKNLKNNDATFSAMAENVASKQKYNTLKIGLTLPDEVLKKNIHTRLLTRIKKGMLKEIKNLHSPKHCLGLSWKRMEALGLEYRYGALYLQGKFEDQKAPSSPSGQFLEKLETEIWHYAKRQKTWFKRDSSTLWIDPREIHEKAKVFKKVRDFLK